LKSRYYYFQFWIHVFCFHGFFFLNFLAPALYGWLLPLNFKLFKLFPRVFLGTKIFHFFLLLSHLLFLLFLSPLFLRLPFLQALLLQFLWFRIMWFILVHLEILLISKNFEALHFRLTQLSFLPFVLFFHFWDHDLVGFRVIGFEGVGSHLIGQCIGQDFLFLIQKYFIHSICFLG